VKYTTGETLAKSITYEHLLEHTFCLFESGVREINLVASAAAFDLIVVISHMPECVASTEFVVFRHDIVCDSHCRTSTKISISLMMPSIA
jgi:hypothetical protein